MKYILNKPIYSAFSLGNIENKSLHKTLDMLREIGIEPNKEFHISLLYGYIYNYVTIQEIQNSYFSEAYSRLIFGIVSTSPRIVTMEDGKSKAIILELSNGFVSKFKEHLRELKIYKDPIYDNKLETDFHISLAYVDSLAEEQEDTINKFVVSNGYNLNDYEQVFTEYKPSPIEHNQYLKEI